MNELFELLMAIPNLVLNKDDPSQDLELKTMIFSHLKDARNDQNQNKLSEQQFRALFFNKIKDNFRESKLNDQYINYTINYMLACEKFANQSVHFLLFVTKEFQQFLAIESDKPIDEVSVAADELVPITIAVMPTVSKTKLDTMIKKMDSLGFMGSDERAYSLTTLASAMNVTQNPEQFEIAEEKLSEKAKNMIALENKFGHFFKTTTFLTSYLTSYFSIEIEQRLKKTNSTLYNNIKKDLKPNEKMIDVLLEKMKDNNFSIGNQKKKDVKNSMALIKTYQIILNTISNNKIRFGEKMTAINSALRND